MKRVIIASVMLLLAVTVAASGSFRLKRSINSVINDIENLQSYTDNHNSEQINTKLQIITDKWIKIEKKLGFISLQDKTSVISEKLKLLIYTDTSKDTIKTSLEEIVILLDSFLYLETPFLQNIF